MAVASGGGAPRSGQPPARRSSGGRARPPGRPPAAVCYGHSLAYSQKLPEFYSMPTRHVQENSRLHSIGFDSRTANAPGDGCVVQWSGMIYRKPCCRKAVIACEKVLALRTQTCADPGTLQRLRAQAEKWGIVGASTGKSASARSRWPFWRA